MGLMPEYVLRRPSAASITPPVLDDSQQAVLDHFNSGSGGPLQVQAGPGAGKTTALVELVVDRVENGGLSPDQILVLTFSRKAAQEVRSRIARRLARTMSTSPAMTFHAFCYALLRAEQSPTDFASPIRLLSAPENDARSPRCSPASMQSSDPPCSVRHCGRGVSRRSCAP